MRKRSNAVLAAITAAVLLYGAGSAEARGKIQSYVERGGNTVTTAGMVSTTKVQRSFALANVTVYLTGTLTIASIYSDNSGTVKANPFTADATGLWFFYADDGRYDVKFSDCTPTCGITSPWTISDLQLSSAATSLTIASCPSDGVTDATTCINAAITAAESGTRGNELYVPAGSYLVNGGSGAAVNVSQFSGTFVKSLLIRGAGEKATRFLHNGTNVVFDLSSSNYVTLQDFGIDAGANTQVGILLARLSALPNCKDNNIMRVRMDGSYSKAALYNVAAESIRTTNVWFRNQYSNAGAGATTYFVGDTNALTVTVPGGALSSTASTIQNTITDSDLLNAGPSSTTTAVIQISNLASTGVVSLSVIGSQISLDGSGVPIGVLFTSASTAVGIGQTFISHNLLELNGGDAFRFVSSSGAAVFTGPVIVGNTISQSRNITACSGSTTVNSLVYRENSEYFSTVAPAFHVCGTMQWANVESSSITNPSAITAATNATPIVITLSSPSVLQTGDIIAIDGVVGNTAANGTWKVTKNDTTHYQLVGSVGNGAYVSGGVPYLGSVIVLDSGATYVGSTLKSRIVFEDGGSSHGSKTIQGLGSGAAPYRYEERYKGWPFGGTPRILTPIWETTQSDVDTTLKVVADKGRIVTGDGGNFIPGSTQTGVSVPLPSIWTGTTYHWMTIVPTDNVPASTAAAATTYPQLSPGSCLINATGKMYCKTTAAGAWYTQQFTILP